MKHPLIKPLPDHFDDPTIGTPEQEERAAIADIARSTMFNGLRWMREAVVAAEWNELGFGEHPGDCKCNDCVKEYCCTGISQADYTGEEVWYECGCSQSDGNRNSDGCYFSS